MIVIPAASRVTILNLILNKDAGEELDLHIFKNDVTPSDATVLADFTEADFTGYTSVELNSATYATTQGNAVTDPAEANYGFVTFTSSTDQTSQNCYGYYIRRRTTGDLLWCERFTDGPYNISNNGDAFSIDPRFELDTADAIPEV